MTDGRIDGELIFQMNPKWTITFSVITSFILYFTADERGKWWVVGSAWEGNITRPEEKPAAKLVPTADQKLLELARKQRMNTDVRRSIFCVIMAAEVSKSMSLANNLFKR